MEKIRQIRHIREDDMAKKNRDDDYRGFYNMADAINAAMEEDRQIRQDSEKSLFEEDKEGEQFEKIFAGEGETQPHNEQEDPYRAEEAVPAEEDEPVKEETQEADTKEAPAAEEKKHELTYEDVKELEESYISFEKNLTPEELEDISNGITSAATEKYIDYRLAFETAEKEYNESHDKTYSQMKAEMTRPQETQAKQPGEPEKEDEMPESPQEVKKFFENVPYSSFIPEDGEIDEDEPGFSEEMSAEEIADRALYAASRRDEETYLNINGTEIEFIKPEQDTKEIKEAREKLKEAREKRKLEAKDIKGADDVIIYIDGKKAVKSDLINFINDHKKEVVNALNDTFPNFNKMVKKDIEEQKRQAEKLEKKIVKEVKKTAPKDKARQVAEDLKQTFSGSKMKTATEHAVNEEKKENKNEDRESVDKKLDRATDKAVRAGLDSAIKKYFDGKSYRNDTFYLTNKEGVIDHTIKLSQSKDGTKTIRMDGKNALEGDLKKMLENYPGQMEKQLSALLDRPGKDKNR